MNIILFDDPAIRQALLPLTYTRPVANLRVGILTIDEKWKRRLDKTVSFHTEKYLQQKFPLKPSDDNLLINGAVCPDQELINALQALPKGHGLMHNDMLIAARSTSTSLPESSSLSLKEFSGQITIIDAVWKIFKENRDQIIEDFQVIKDGRTSAHIDDPHTIMYGKENIFIENGANIKAAVLNAETGPIYIGKNAEIQEGAVIRGAFALLEGGVVNMGAKMRGDSTVGPFSKVGGEISNSVIQGYSNKGHDGFMGNSVLGEWCNLGADTNTSNLKNNYASVKIWDYAKKGFADTGETFCGLIMGDHSKCGINTMFNTGTVVGVSSNIFGSGFPRNFIPSFAWGGAAGFSTYKLNKVYEVAEKVMARRKKDLDEVEKGILEHLYDATVEQRFWEKK